MKYKFVKIYCKQQKAYFPWMLVCDNVDTLIQHTEKYNGNLIKGFENLISDEHNNEFNQYSKAIECVSQTDKTSIIVAATKLDNKIYNGKLKAINNHEFIFLRDNGSYCVSSNSFVIINEIIKDDILYPEYGVKDIKISQWKNGKHYYAKIGNMDVKDINENYKWNSYDEAYNVAVGTIK